MWNFIKYLFWFSCFVYVSPYLKLWVDVFLKQPYRVAAITTFILILLTLVLVVIQTCRDEREWTKKPINPKYIVVVEKYGLPQSMTSNGEFTSFAYKYNICPFDNPNKAIRHYEDIIKAYDVCKMLNEL